MMPIVYYYRTHDAAVIAGKQADNEKAVAVEAAGREFAALFGALPVFSQEITPRFLGVTFTKEHPPAQPRMWTSPKKGDARMYPKLNNLPAKLAALAHQTNKLWTERYPHWAGEERESSLLKSLGLSVQALQGQGFSYFYDKQDVSWIMSTAALLREEFEEILATQFALGFGAWQVSLMPKVEAVDEVKNEEAANE